MSALLRPQSATARRQADLAPPELTAAAKCAQGKTNRQTKTRLFLSPHTLDSHLRPIFTKLSISSRVTLTRWVIENVATTDI